jgi:hypothetical protein
MSFRRYGSIKPQPFHLLSEFLDLPLYSRIPGAAEPEDTS